MILRDAQSAETAKLRLTGTYLECEIFHLPNEIYITALYLFTINFQNVAGENAKCTCNEFNVQMDVVTLDTDVILYS